MSLMMGAGARLRQLFRRAAEEERMDDEMRFHIEMETEKNLRAGMGPEEARRRAVIDFGGMQTHREELREGRRLPLLEEALHNLRYAARTLRRSPAFTVAAVLTLGLGIGGTSAIFSVVNAVLLRPLPFPEPDRLVRVFDVAGKDGMISVAPANYLDYRDQGMLFTGVAAYEGRSNFELMGPGDPIRLAGAEVSAEFFDVLGVRPTLGRGFREEENEPGHAGVVVLSHTVWQQLYGSDRGILGRVVSVDGVARTVVGVMPPGFGFPDEATLWTPMKYSPPFLDPGNRASHYLGVVARLRPGVTPERAAAEMAAVGDRIRSEAMGGQREFSATATPLKEVIVGDTRPALMLLLGAVGLMLLIACANVANLLLARATAREGEVALRSALGAGRGRLLRQLLTESLVLAAAGGALGLLVAFGGTRLLLALQPDALPRVDGVRVDPAVVGFTALVSVVTGLLFGLVPALQVTRAGLFGALREGGRGALSGRRGNGLRRALVVAQTALAVLLLAGSGLLIRSFVRLVSVDPGFRGEGVLSVNVTVPNSRYEDTAERERFYSELIARVERIPGVVSAGLVSGLPLGGRSIGVGMNPTDGPLASSEGGPAGEMRVVSSGYFRALGIPLLRGRGFTPADRADSPPALVLSEHAAQRLFPGSDALGRRVMLSAYRGPNDPVGGVVVGIVRSVRYQGLDRVPESEVYVPLAQLPMSSMDLTVRTSADPLSLAGSIRAAVRELDPNLPIADFRTVDQVVSESVSQPRFYTLLLTIFAAVALSLTAVGIFGVIAYGVAKRTREIGVRLALGAAPGSVVAMMVTQGMRLVLLGLAVGLVLTLALSRIVEGLLFGITPTDPLTLAVVVLVLSAVALLACYLPARRVTHVDPMLALRYD